MGQWKLCASAGAAVQHQRPDVSRVRWGSLLRSNATRGNRRPGGAIGRLGAGGLGLGRGGGVARGLSGLCRRSARHLLLGLGEAPVQVLCGEGAGGEA